MANQAPFEADVEVSLREQGLRHAPGQKCCDGCAHLMSVQVSDSDIELIVARFGPRYAPFDGEDEAGVLQALHEQAHPDGAVFWANCRERGCREAGEI